MWRTAGAARTAAREFWIRLSETGIPDEYQPSLSVRLLGVSDRAIASYLVNAYYSVAVLVPDALGILENIEIQRQS